jgi:hypothetical protein
MGDIGRYKVLAVAPTFLTLVLTDGAVTPAVKAVGGLPPGTRFVSGFYDPGDDLFLIKFEHDSWPEVAVGPVWELPRLAAVQFSILDAAAASAAAPRRTLAGPSRLERGIGEAADRMPGGDPAEVI